MKIPSALRHVTDLLMILTLLGLMAYFLTGQAVHEWLGAAALVLFVLHHIWNGKWLAALGKGGYPPARILQTALAVLLLISMLAQMVSGIAMSRHALSFLDLPVPISAARLIHLACGQWTWLLTGLHLGVHWSAFLGLGRKTRGGKPLHPAGRRLLRLAALAAAGWGLACFLAQRIPDYLFLRTQFAFFDYEKPVLLTAAELLAMLALWTLVGYLLQKLALRLGRSHRKERPVS